MSTVTLLESRQCGSRACALGNCPGLPYQLQAASIIYAAFFSLPFGKKSTVFVQFMSSGMLPFSIIPQRHSYQYLDLLLFVVKILLNLFQLARYFHNSKPDVLDFSFLLNMFIIYYLKLLFTGKKENRFGYLFSFHLTVQYLA